MLFILKIQEYIKRLPKFKTKIRKKRANGSQTWM